MSNFKVSEDVVLDKNGHMQNFPTGSIIPFFTTSIPNGWILCNGSSLATTGTYENLFNIIGYTYGGSGGSFNIPSMNNLYPSSSNANNSTATYPSNHQHNTSANASVSSHGSISHSHTGNIYTYVTGSASHNHNTPISGVNTNGGVTPGSNANSVANRAINSGPAANSPQAGWVGHTHNAGSGAVNLANSAFNHNHWSTAPSYGMSFSAGTVGNHTIAAFNGNHTAGGVTPLASKAYFIIKY